MCRRSTWAIVWVAAGLLTAAGCGSGKVELAETPEAENVYFLKLHEGHYHVSKDMALRLGEDRFLRDGEGRYVCDHPVYVPPSAERIRVSRDGEIRALCHGQWVELGQLSLLRLRPRARRDEDGELVPVLRTDHLGKVLTPGTDEWVAIEPAEWEVD